METSQAGIYLDSTLGGGRRWNIWSTASGIDQIGGSLVFYDESVGQYRMVVNSDGNIGIGTIFPQAKLHIESPPAGLTFGTWNSSNLSNGQQLLQFIGKNNGLRNGFWNWYSHAADGSESNSIRWDVNGRGNILYLRADGNVGIGTDNPASKFDVNGLASMSSISVSGAASSGSMNISGALNVSGSSNTIGSIFTTGGNVGLGIVAPSQRLDVSGSIRITNGSLIATGAANTVGSIITTEGNVGIGIVAPSQRLDVSGSIRITNGSLIATGAANTVGSLFTTGGNVGIGTTSPSAKLDVNGLASMSSISVSGAASSGSMNISGALNVSGSSNTIGSIFTTGGNVGLGIVAPSQRLDVSGSIRITNGSLIATGAANTIGSLFTTGGNVGIGTTAPQSALHVQGEIKAGSISGYDGNWFTVKNGAGAASMTLRGGTIDVNANVGIGTDSPSYPLDIAVASGNLNFGAPDKYFGSGVGTLQDAAVSTPISIKAASSIWTGGLFVATSDIRIKKNLQDINDSSALNTLRTIEPKTYNYVDTVSRSNETVYGFSAQQIKQVLPYAVSIQTDFVPNVFSSVTVGNNGTQLILPDTSVLQNQMTDGSTFIPIRCYVDDNDTQQIVNITQIVDEHIVQIDTQITSGSTVFLYGQEVNDFHTLNKDSIWSVSVAALQEVDRQLQDTKARVAALEERLSAAGL